MRVIDVDDFLEWIENYFQVQENQITLRDMELFEYVIEDYLMLRDLDDES